MGMSPPNQQDQMSQFQPMAQLGGSTQSPPPTPGSTSGKSHDVFSKSKLDPISGSMVHRSNQIDSFASANPYSISRVQSVLGKLPPTSSSLPRTQAFPAATPTLFPTQGDLSRRSSLIAPSSLPQQLRFNNPQAEFNPQGFQNNFGQQQSLQTQLSNINRQSLQNQFSNPQQQSLQDQFSNPQQQSLQNQFSISQQQSSNSRFPNPDHQSLQNQFLNS